MIVSVFMQVLTGNEIPPTPEIGPGLMIWHSGGIVIHSHSKIGSSARCIKASQLGSGTARETLR